MNGCIIKFLDVQVVHNDIRKMSKNHKKTATYKYKWKNNSLKHDGSVV